MARPASKGGSVASAGGRVSASKAGAAYVPVGSDEVDLEDGGIPLDEELDRMHRHAFVRKVYGILSAQIALTAAVSAVLTLVRPCRDFVLGHPSLLMPGLIGSVLVLLALMAFKDRHPLNAQLLGVWTLFQAYTVGVVCSATAAAGQGSAVIEALVITGAVFLGLTLFTFQSKIDFSFLGAGLSAGLMILIVWGLFGVFFGHAAGGVYSLFGALLFSGYIVFDTFLITQKIGYDDYILAAVTLYLDLVNLFFYILQIVASRGGGGGGGDN